LAAIKSPGWQLPKTRSLCSIQNFHAKDDVVDDIEHHEVQLTNQNAQIQFSDVTELAMLRLASI